MTDISNFTVVAEHEHFIVIDKACNTNFHDEGDVGSGLFNEVKNQLNLAELYPVHRLDKMTSGLLIFAKNQTSAVAFQQLFSEHQIEKFYLAISAQKPKKKQGLIKGDMAKSRRSMWKLLRTTNNPAITQFFSYSLSGGKRLYLLKPHTGKTHQIRVALSSIGAPILGDELYSNTSADRGYLHAYALSFTLHEQSYQFILPPKQGQYFQEIDQISEIATPWQLAWPKL